MKAVLLMATLALTACGVDGPPERPAVVQQVVVADYPATYTDAGGVVRTTAKSVAASSAVVGTIPDGI